MLTSIARPQRRFYVDSDMDSPELLAMAGGNVVAISRRCPQKVEPNDDSGAVVETTSGAIVLIVADGVGGCPLGYKASAVAVEAVGEAVQSADPSSDLRTAILDGIEKANRLILELGAGAATTIAVVEIFDAKARAYHVGDSMTVIIGQRGAMKWKSMPHSPVGYAVESGMLNEDDAMHHDDRHVVSNFVGSDSMHIEVGPIRKLAARDTIISGTDGLFDNLHLSEVIEHGKSGKPVARMNTLVDLAASRMQQAREGVPGKPDDLTVLLYTA